MGKPILCIGDLHLYAPTEFNLPEVDRNFLVDKEIETLRWILNFGKSKGADTTVFLGDIQTQKDKIPSAVKNPFLDLLDEFSGMKKIIVTGNHDRDGRAIRYLKPYAEIYNKAVTRNNLNGLKAAFVPYKKDPTVYNSLLEQWGRDERILFTHNFIEGHTPPDSKGLPLKLLKRFTATLCGHQHDHTGISVEDGIYYLGSIYQEDFAEAGQDKFVALIYGQDNVKFEKIPLFIKRVQYTLDASTDVKKIGHDLTSPSLVKLEIRDNTRHSDWERLRIDLVNAQHYVKVTKLLQESSGKSIKTVVKSQSAVMSRFYRDILKGRDAGERYFLKRAIDGVQKRLKEREEV